MKTLKIHFTGGSALTLELPEDDCAGLLKMLSVDNNGMTTVTVNYEPGYLINRAHIAFASIS
jgi:hypothetical protein